MPREIRSRITYPNVVSSLALLVALAGGTAWAADEWTGENIENGTLTSADYRNDDIRSVDIRDDSRAGGGLTSTDLAPGAVGTSEVVDGSIASGDVADQSLTGSDVRNNTINADDVFGLRGNDDIEDGSLTGADVASGSITGGDIATDTVGSEDVRQEGLRGEDIDEGTLVGVQPKIRWALVNGVGKVIDQTGGIMATPSDDPNSTRVFVNFGSSLLGKAIFVNAFCQCSTTQPRLASTNRCGNVEPFPVLNCEEVGGPPGSNHPSYVIVDRFGDDGSAERAPFWIAVMQ